MGWPRTPSRRKPAPNASSGSLRVRWASVRSRAPTRAQAAICRKNPRKSQAIVPSPSVSGDRGRGLSPTRGTSGTLGRMDPHPRDARAETGVRAG